MSPGWRLVRITSRWRLVRIRHERVTCDNVPGTCMPTLASWHSLPYHPCRNLSPTCRDSWVSSTPECWSGYINSKPRISAVSTFEIHCLEGKLTFGDPFLDSGVARARACSKLGKSGARLPRGKSMVSSVNSHTNATRIGWHLWEVYL